MYLEKKQDQRT